MTAAKTKGTKTEMKKVVSKRQKIKAGPNKSNTWAQQPKIKSMDARDKAYIHMAGLGQSSKRKKSPSVTKAPLNPDDDIINSPEFKFGRLLASPLARTRHATILKLKDYLKARTDPSNDNGGLSILDLMKLWKGLWHTLYLCDGVAVQEEVSKVLAQLIWSVGGSLEEDEYAGRFYLDLDEEMAEAGEDEDNDEEDTLQVIEMSDEEGNIAPHDKGQRDGADNDDNDSPDSEDDVENPADDEETKHCRGAHLSALYIRTYFRTLNREWSNMDKYRIDKFYTLTRFVLRESYRYMASRHWNLGIIRLFNDAIFEEVLREQRYGNGVKFHLLDICLDELALVNSEKETGLPLTEATFLDCMEPYFAMAQRVEDNIVHERVMEKVMSKFLNEYSIVSDNYSVEPSNKKRILIMDQVHVQTVAQFLFELGSDAETEDRYRKQLYDMHKTYVKRVKLIGRDVLMDDGNEEENDISHNSNVDHIGHDCGKKECQVENEEDTSEPAPETCVEEGKKKKKKKKKKKDKKKVLQKDSSDDLQKNSDNGKGKTDQGDSVITISSEEQKAAAKAALKVEKKKKTTKKRAANPDLDCAAADDELPTPKKVKFGKVTRSKSYKASMRDLTKVDEKAKATLKKTPEKSILMKRKERKYKSKLGKKKSI